MQLRFNELKPVELKKPSNFFGTCSNDHDGKLDAAAFYVVLNPKR